VAHGLMNLGWQVVSQIGVSRFRIDLGIVHPDTPGDYLVGVECDGASYHSAATARDRDKVRAVVLQGLGWRLLRVWSTEWWVDKAGALQRLHESIQQLLEESRSEKQQEHEPSFPEIDDQEETEASLYASERNIYQDEPTETLVIQEVASARISAEAPSCGVYQIADLTGFAEAINAARFYDEEYDEVLTGVIGHVLRCEAPILDALLVQRIARAHGFLKAGRLIRERVLELVDRHYHIRPDPSGGNFVWVDKESPDQWFHYRTHDSEETIRRIEEIPLEELRAAALDCPNGDLPVEIARKFGTKRLSASVRDRLETIFQN